MLPHVQCTVQESPSTKVALFTVWIGADYKKRKISLCRGTVLLKHAIGVVLTQTE
jgi:hypothetical protein